MKKFLKWFLSPIHVPRAGDTWKLTYRWSGYAIASEDRKDGGCSYVRFDAIDPDGTLTVDEERMSWDAFRTRYLAVDYLHSTGRFRQTRTRTATYIGRTETAPTGRRGAWSQGVHDALAAGGIAGVHAFLQAQQPGARYD